MQRIPNHLNLHLFIDFAHTEDALKSALTTLKSLLGQKKLWVLFGCGGDRDLDKRPKMGRIASSLSDHVIITSDNPRSEDPLAICREIASGSLKKNYLIECDRRKAIAKVLKMAAPGDCVLVAGKGCERTQTFADKTYPFDDRQVIEEVLANQFTHRV